MTHDALKRYLESAPSLAELASVLLPGVDSDSLIDLHAGCAQIWQASWRGEGGYGIELLLELLRAVGGYDTAAEKGTAPYPTGQISETQAVPEQRANPTRAQLPARGGSNNDCATAPGWPGKRAIAPLAVPLPRPHQAARPHRTAGTLSSRGSHNRCRLRAPPQISCQRCTRCLQRARSKELPPSAGVEM